jgi:hypothetical protein
MACLTTAPYTITGCTDATTYGPGSTTVDFQLACPNNTGQQTFSYWAYLQKYNRSTAQWENYDVRSGSFYSSTKVFSYDIANAPAGTYRINVKFKSDTSTTYFYAHTGDLIIQ